MEKRKKVILELKKESIVTLGNLPANNIVGGYVAVGLTTLNVCQPGTGTGTNTSGRLHG